MSTWRYARAAARRWQWEKSSGTFDRSQSNNCGPTCVSFIAGYYNDNRPGIERTRLLVTGPGTPTSAWDQMRMLEARGVPTDAFYLDTLGELHTIIGSGRRPIILGVDMSRVPYTYRGHSFTSWHAIVAQRTELAFGDRGVDILDPNFSTPAGHRPDPQGGHRYYPDSVIASAYLHFLPRWAIVPEKAKPLPAVEYVMVEAGARIRERPFTSSRLLHVPAVDRRAILLDAREGGRYRFWTGSRWEYRRRWRKVDHPAGVTGWIKWHNASRISGTDAERLAGAEEGEERELIRSLRRVTESEARELLHDPIPTEVNEEITGGE